MMWISRSFALLLNLSKSKEQITVTGWATLEHWSLHSAPILLSLVWSQPETSLTGAKYLLKVPEVAMKWNLTTSKHFGRILGNSHRGKSHSLSRYKEITPLTLNLYMSHITNIQYTIKHKWNQLFCICDVYEWLLTTIPHQFISRVL